VQGLKLLPWLASASYCHDTVPSVTFTLFYEYFVIAGNCVLTRTSTKP